MPRHFGWESFAFGFGPRGAFWAGPRRRRRQWFESGDMKYVILKVLKDKPRHGYEVMKELEDQLRGCYSPSAGTVYPTLQLLEDEGLVTSREVEGKKIYEVTDAGRACLEEHKDVVDDIFERVRDTVERALGGASGFAGRYAASAAAPIDSSGRSVPVSAAPASATSCGRLPTPPSTTRAAAT